VLAAEEVILKIKASILSNRSTRLVGCQGTAGLGVEANPEDSVRDNDELGMERPLESVIYPKKRKKILQFILCSFPPGQLIIYHDHWKYDTARIEKKEP
jgi:hypothetical protein